MFRDKKTQFAIRKLTTGTGILLLSVGMGINLSSKEVSASEIDPAQTTETVQTEAATESTAEQEPAVEFSAPVQETEGTSTVESTPNVEETTVTEAPAETVTQEKQESAESVTETEKEIQDTTVTDSTNNENNDAVNTDSQAPKVETNTQPETDKADESEKVPAKNEVDYSSEKEESKADSDKKDEVEKNENELDKENIKNDAINIDGSILPDAAKPDKDNINDFINSILSDPDKLAEFEGKANWTDAILQGIIKWIEDNRLSWDHISDQEKYPGWEDVFDESLKIDRVDPFDHKNPQWQATANKEITITQTVNNGSQQSTQQIKVNYDVVIYIAIDPNMSGWDALFGNYKFIISDVKVSNINKVDPNTNVPKDEFDAVNIPTAPEGFENKVTGTIEGPKFDDYNINNNINIEDKVIKTNLDSILNTILQKGTDVTFKYDIEQIAVKKPTWTDVIDGDNINKADWNDIFQNVDFIQGTDGNWTGKVTFNKDIIQNINGLDQGSSQTINLTKDITIIVERVDNTNTFKIKDVIDSKWASTGSLGSTNISKPGYNYEVSTEITGTNKENVSTNKENGNLSTIIDFEKLENNNDKVTINYTVNYTPDWSGVDLPDNVKFDKKDDHTWTGTSITDKVITQTVNGISQQIKLSQTVTYTLTLNDNGWVLSNDKDTAEVKVEGNKPINIPIKPGHTIDKVEDNNNNLNFTLENGQIVVTDDAWKAAWGTLTDKDSINYTVTYKIDQSKLDWPEKIDDWKDNGDGTWSGNTTINKVINQTWANGSNQITLSQAANVTFTWNAEKDKWVPTTINGFGDVTVKDDNPLNISKPGYNHSVSATIDGTEFKGFTVNDDGSISINKDAWNSLKNNDTINYEVTYTIDKDKVKLPDGLDKGDITDWTENSDGTVTVTINKTINQNVINGDANTLTLSQKATFTLAWSDTEQKLVATIKSLDEVSVTENNSLNINKPGYNHSVSATIDGAEFKGYKVDDAGNIIVDAKTWTDLTKVQNGTTIKYKVTHTPNWENVKWPEDIDKDDINIWDQDDKGNWSGTATIDKVITQTVNGKNTNNITLSQSVKVTLTWDKDKGQLIAIATPVSTITVDGNSPININKPGYKHEVTSDDNLDFKVENGQITITNETLQNAWATLKNGDKINYTVTYSPDWTDVKWPEGMGKDDFEKDPDAENTWNANTTINKVINQTVVNGDSNTITWSQNISFTLTFKDGKWVILDKKANPTVTIQGDKLNINKPGYTIDKVNASIDKQYFTIDNAGNIVLDDNIWGTIKDGASLDIEYEVTYKPDWNNVDWPEDIDKDKIENWTENTDGSWTGTTSINKVINQTANGTSNQITLSQAVTVNLTLKDGIWTADTVPGTVTVKDDNPLNITKPGYNYSKDDVSASINDTEFNGFKVDDNGNIIVAADAWATLNNGDTINYTVKYTPNWDNVQWPEDIDKDKIENWTQIDDGSWTGNTTINKVINQTVTNGGSNTLTWSQAVKVTLTLKDGKWTAVADKGVVTVKVDKDLNITKPGYNHNVSASIGNSEFKEFKVENGNIVLNDSIWNTIKNDEKLNIKYDVIYSPNFGDIKLPEGIDKDNLQPDPDKENTFIGSFTTDKVINQTVNGQPANDITFSQTVSVTVTWDKENGQWVVSEPKVEINGYTPIDINKPGYSIDKVEADILGESDFKVEDGKLVVADKALANLQNGQTINYTVTYSPDWSGVELPDDINKDDLKPDPDKEDTWTANITINKVITQNIANANGNLNQITLSQAATVTLTLKDGKWTVDIKGFGDVTVKDDNPINVNRPGYKHDVSASIDDTKFDGFKIDDDGNIVINASAWDILKDGDTISYIVNYTPIKPQPDTVNPPAKDDNIWSDDVTDKEKDDIIDKIEDGDLTWTDNGDGTWSATVDFNKQLSQSISGNMINGLPNITVDVTKKVTLIAELKGDKFHITSVTSGKWTSDSNLGQKLPESDNKYDISATVNGNDHAELKAEVENTNTIPGLDSDLIQSIINNHEYGSLLQLSYVINANPGSADPDKPAEPDTPNVDPDMGVDPENPSNPDDNNGSDDSNNSGNNPGSSDSTENTTPKPEEGPEVKPVTTPTEFTPPLSEDIEDDNKKANPDSDSAQSESNKDNKGKTVTGSKATGKKATIISLSESTTASQNSSANSQNSLATTDNEIALPQTGKNKDNLSMMGIIMAGLAGALTTLGTAIKKKKKN